MIGTYHLTSYQDIINHPDLDYESSILLRKIFNNDGDKHKKLIDNLFSIISKQKHKILDLQFQLKQALDQLALNSQNSSKPPSTDTPFKRKTVIKSERERTHKKSGGQSGRKGKTLNQVNNPDQIISHNVFSCKKCDQSLPNEPSRLLRRQIFEVGESRFNAIEHRVLVKRCIHCKTENRTKFPDHVRSRVQYGLRTKERILYLFSNQYIPYERITDYFFDIYHHRVSEGTVNNVLKSVYYDLDDWEEDNKESILESYVLHSDESGIKINGELHWLHVYSTKYHTYFSIHKNRGSKAIDDIGILPKYTGHAVHDGYKAYFKYKKCEHVLCNAHHLRELRNIYESGGLEAKFAKQMRDHLKYMNYVIKQAKENGKVRLQGELIDKFRYKYSSILKKWESCYKKHLQKDKDDLQLPLIDEDAQPPPFVEGKRKQSKGKNLFDRLKKYKKNILLFLRDFKIPFDNNLAERDIRMAKLKQKISGTFRTSMGGKIFCRIRSFISTMKKQGKTFSEAMDLIY